MRVSCCACVSCCVVCVVLFRVVCVRAQSQVCPASIEGTLFAFIMQMSNTGKSYARYCGAWVQHALGITLADFTGLQVSVTAGDEQAAALRNLVQLSRQLSRPYSVGAEPLSDRLRHRRTGRASG